MEEQKPMADDLLVLTTVPDEDTADKLALLLVERRLAACVTRSIAGRSVYRWQGKITQDDEYILFIKTTSERYPELEKELVKAHPYEVPEVLALPVERGYAPYLSWLGAETDPDGTGRP